MIPEALVRLLQDESVTDLFLSGPGEVIVDRGSGLETVPSVSIFSSDLELRQFAVEQLSLAGKTWDAKLPFADAVFFGTHRAHLVFPPVSPAGVLLSLRRLPGRHPGVSLHDLQTRALARWSESGMAFELLRESVKKRESILFAGATGSGKTTLFNDLLLFVPPHERILALEDTAELSPAHPRFVSLLTRSANADGFGAVTLRDLVRQTLRMRPDRILIGECRGDEVLDLLLALNTGHQGSMSTIHASSARDAAARLELLALIAARGQIPDALVRSLIARGIRKIAFLKRSPDARRIEEVIAIEGIERGVICARTLTSRNRASEAPRLPFELRAGD